MRWSELEKQSCSVARTISVIGDRWTLMILRDCFTRLRRFEEFQESLGITRHLLADRLKKLVKEGVLRKEAYQDRPKRYEYRLTPKGLDLHPVMMAVVHWGDTYMAATRGPPLLHRHKQCGHTFNAVTTCSACGEALGARDVEVLPGPGATEASRARIRNR